MPIYPSGYYVYTYLRTSNSTNGDIDTPYYIGKGKDNRAFKKLKHEIHPPRDKSKIIILEENMSEDKALEAEKLLIRLFGRVDLGTGCLRNKTDGGEGGSGAIRTKEQREKLRAKNLGKKQSKETIAKRVAKNTGKKRSQKICDDISARTSGKGHPFFGSTHKEETKTKIKNALKGRPSTRKGIVGEVLSEVVKKERKEKMIAKGTWGVTVDNNPDAISKANKGRFVMHNPTTGDKRRPKADDTEMIASLLAIGYVRSTCKARTEVPSLA